MSAATNPSVLAGQAGGDVEPGIRGFIGGSGSGKSFTLTERLYEMLHRAPTTRAMRLDINEEVQAVPKWLLEHSVGVRSAADAARDLNAGKRLAIVKLADNATSDDWSRALDEAAKWAVSSRDAIVAVSEMHLALPNAGPAAISGYTLKLLTAWRHRRASLFWDSQRLALVNRTLTAQSSELSIFSVVDDVDRKTLRTIGGDELLAAIDDINAAFKAGERGKHVRLGLDRTPPFVPVKVTPRYSV